MKTFQKTPFLILIICIVLAINAGTIFAAVHVSTNVPVSIPDGFDLTGNNPGAPATSVINVSGEESIVDVNLSVNISHTFVSDLVITLSSPGGTTIRLMSGACGSRNNINVIIDDEAPSGNSLQACTPPGIGTEALVTGETYAPADPLSNFDGELANGTWTLTMQDFFSQDEGMLNAWSLDLTTAPLIAPVITSAPAANAVLGAPFSHTFTAAGDPAPTLSYSAENLPPGITRTGDTLSGVATLDGQFSITVTASNGVAPDAVQVFVITVGGLPVPPPTPLCEDHNFSEAGVVRSSTADAFGHALNCRVLYQNGAPTSWLGGDLYNGGSIGVEGINELGVQTAIDIFSPSGTTYFEGGAVFCLKGSGWLIWLAAAGAPRVPEIIGSYEVPEWEGFTCATLFEPGTLVLVSQNPIR